MQWAGDYTNLSCRHQQCVIMSISNYSSSETFQIDACDCIEINTF